MGIFGHILAGAVQGGAEQRVSDIEAQEKAALEAKKSAEDRAFREGLLNTRIGAEKEMAGEDRAFQSEEAEKGRKFQKQAWETEQEYQDRVRREERAREDKYRQPADVYEDIIEKDDGTVIGVVKGTGEKVVIDKGSGLPQARKEALIKDREQLMEIVSTYDPQGNPATGSPSKQQYETAKERIQSIEEQLGWRESERPSIVDIISNLDFKQGEVPIEEYQQEMMRRGYSREEIQKFSRAYQERKKAFTTKKKGDTSKETPGPTTPKPPTSTPTTKPPPTPTKGQAQVVWVEGQGWLIKDPQTGQTRRPITEEEKTAVANIRKTTTPPSAPYEKPVDQAVHGLLERFGFK